VLSERFDSVDVACGGDANRRRHGPEIPGAKVLRTRATGTNPA
jgi:hypothetical protein